MILLLTLIILCAFWALGVMFLYDGLRSGGLFNAPWWLELVTIFVGAALIGAYV